jgi:alpha-L-fucosidase
MERDSVRVDSVREQDLAFGRSSSRSIWRWAGGAGRLDMRIKDKLKLLAPRV